MLHRDYELWHVENYYQKSQYAFFLCFSHREGQCSWGNPCFKVILWQTLPSPGMIDSVLWGVTLAVLGKPLTLWARLEICVLRRVCGQQKVLKFAGIGVSPLFWGSLRTWEILVALGGLVRLIERSEASVALTWMFVDLDDVFSESGWFVVVCFFLSLPFSFLEIGSLYTSLTVL